MTITIDECPYTIVVYCSDCGHWSRSAVTRDEAHDIAANHELRVHPTIERARKRRDKHLERKRMQHAD